MPIAKERKQLGGGGLLEKKDDGAIVVERLFSNLNEATLEHEPGSLSSAVLLIAGTTVHPSLIPLHFLSANLLHVIVILNCCFFYGILLSSSEKRRFLLCWKILGSGSCCEQEGFALGNFLFFSIL
jgi:hypothetical protein